MLLRLFLLFTIIPLAELALLLWLADVTSWQFTLGLVIVTGVLGAWLARLEGWRAMSRIQQELGEGKMPGDALLDGVLILVAGVVLVTPGVLTDLLGFGLLIPPLRRIFKNRLKARFARRLIMGKERGVGADWHANSYTPRPGEGEIIDARVIEEEERPSGNN